MASVGKRARVTFDYEAEQPDEITLKVGDIIENIEEEDVGWCKGYVNGKHGLFPSNFVEFIEEAESVSEAKQTAAKVETTNESIAGRKAKVLFDYPAENSDELTLDVGEVIELITEVEDGWWEGKVGGKCGVFPSNFVELVAEDEEPVAKETKPVPPAPPNKEDEEEPDQEMYENMHSTEEMPSAQAQAEEEELSKSTKRRSVIESKKMGGGMGFGNLISSDLLSGINLKKVDQKKEHKEKKATTSAVEPEKSTPKKTSLGSTAKRKAPPVPPVSQPQEAQPPPAKKLTKAKVVFQYDPQNDDELELKLGDIITIINKEVFDTPGWMEGEIGGMTGLFPDNFVEILPEEELTKEKENKPVPPSPKQTTTAVQEKQRAPPPVPEEEKKDQVDAPKPAAEMRRVLGKEPKKPPPLPGGSKPVIDAPKPHLPPKKPVPPKPSVDKKPVVHKKAVPKPPSDTKIKDSRKPAVEIKKPADEKPEGKGFTATENEALNFDSVEPHETLTHLTANRARLQQKRPPSRDMRGVMGDTIPNDDSRDSGEVESEPKEPAWIREAREAREVRKAEEKIAPSVSHVKERKVLPVPKIEEITSSRNELRKSWKEEPPVPKKPTTTVLDQETRKAPRAEPLAAKKPSPTTAVSEDEVHKLRHEVTELRSLVHELSQKFTKLEKKHADDIKNIEHRLKEEIEQLTNDFDEERSNNARLKIEMDRLKKKLSRGSIDTE